MFGESYYSMYICIIYGQAIVLYALALFYVPFLRCIS